jgi:hypothetical protein
MTAQLFADYNFCQSTEHLFTILWSQTNIFGRAARAAIEEARLLRREPVDLTGV